MKNTQSDANNNAAPKKSRFSLINNPLSSILIWGASMFCIIKLMIGYFGEPDSEFYRNLKLRIVSAAAEKTDIPVLKDIQKNLGEDIQNMLLTEKEKEFNQRYTEFQEYISLKNVSSSDYSLSYLNALMVCDQEVSDAAVSCENARMALEKWHNGENIDIKVIQDAETKMKNAIEKMNSVRNQGLDFAEQKRHNAKLLGFLLAQAGNGFQYRVSDIGVTQEKGKFYLITKVQRKFDAASFGSHMAQLLPKFSFSEQQQRHHNLRIVLKGHDAANSRIFYGTLNDFDIATLKQYCRFNPLNASNMSMQSHIELGNFDANMLENRISLSFQNMDTITVDLSAEPWQKIVHVYRLTLEQKDMLIAQNSFVLRKHRFAADKPAPRGLPCDQKIEQEIYRNPEK